MKKVLVALFITGIVFLTSCSVAKKDNVENIVADVGGLTADEVGYVTMESSYKIYRDAKELGERADLALLGRVTDISFQILDMKTGHPPTEKTEERDAQLHTMYTVEVVTLYKGECDKTVQIGETGGIPNYRVEEQLAVLGKDAGNGILVISGMPDILIGETYLFSLGTFEDSSVASALVNLDQGVYTLQDASKKDKFSYVSAKDLISYFGEDKWTDFQAAKADGKITFSDEVRPSSEPSVNTSAPPKEDPAPASPPISVDGE